jgi:hypothetical protein
MRALGGLLHEELLIDRKEKKKGDHGATPKRLKER